jgi:hypothetical protein
MDLGDWEFLQGKSVVTVSGLTVDPEVVEWLQTLIAQASDGVSSPSLKVAELTRLALEAEDSVQLLQKSVVTVLLVGIRQGLLLRST